jgi:4'-phosphopantetheinyl transferase EntD
VATRRHEFATGRVLLRGLLGADVPIAVAADRSPVLPAGVVGSLAHAGSLAVAAVGAAEVARALGVDLEPATPLDDAVAEVILRPDEAGLDPHLAFTLKEAVYKAWSGTGGGMLEHHDVRLSARQDGWFDAAVTTAGASFTARCSEAAGHWVALVVVPAATGR